MNRLCLLTILALIGVTTVHAQLDKAKLAEEYKAWDLSRNGGLGASEATDSGTLGWSESSYLRGYSNMWLAGGDTYWLAKIQDHFTRIMGSATDPDGDGFLGWQTATYSAAVYWCQPLLNRGTGTIDPPFFSEKNAKAIEQVTGHNYVINFVDAATYRVQDQSTRQWVSEALTYKSGEVITAVPGCKVRISGEARTGDRFMVRTLRPEPTEYAVHEGMLAYPVSVFIEAVAKDPKLREQFGASADSFLQFINRNFLQKHEQDWVEYEDGSGAWRFADLITDRFPNRIMPHNQYLALARAFLVLRDVPGADPLMGKRAEQMARLFRRSLIEQDAAWVWHYWDWVEAGEPGHSGFEDTSHGHIDVGFAVEAAMRGVVFTDEDMKRFTRTVLDLMWNGSETNPKLGPNCATKGEDFSILLGDWIDLCRWEPRIYELALTVFEPTAKAAGQNPTMLRAEMLLQ